MDPSFAKSLAAALALAWIALVALWTPAPKEPGRWPWQRLRPRLAILGAAAFGILFLALAAWENGGVPGPEVLEDPDWAARFEEPSRTLSMGATAVAIAVAMAAIGALLGERSRTAARGAILFLLVLVAGAIWPLLSIPRWCAWIAAPADLPAPSPLALYSPDCDPARWLDASARALHPVAPWGMLLAAAGAAAGFLLFRSATARADAPGRESACAAIACCGVLLACFAALEFEKHAAWTARDRFHVIDTRVRELDPALIPKRSILGSLSAPPRAWKVLLVTDSSINEIWLLDYPVDPDIGRPVPPTMIWLSLAASLFAVLFGEFHLRGRRLLRDPVTGEATTGAT